MNFKKFAMAVLVSAAAIFTACGDSSSSTSTEDDTLSSSSIVADPSSSDSDKPASSDSEAPASSSSISSENQPEIPDMGSFEDMEIPECTKAGEELTQDFFGQKITFVCDEDMNPVPKTDISEIINNMDDAVLAPILDSLGMTKEDLEALIGLLQGITGGEESQPTSQVTCTGELNDSEWVMTFSFSAMGFKTEGEAKSVFEGDTQKNTAISKVDFGSPAICKSVLEEEGEVSEGEEVYCEGSVLVTKDEEINENLTEEDRKEAYEEFMESCREMKENGIM